MTTLHEIQMIIEELSRTLMLPSNLLAGRMGSATEARILERKMTILPYYDSAGTGDEHCIRCGRILGSQRVWLNGKGPYCCQECANLVERERARRQEDISSND